MEKRIYYRRKDGRFMSEASAKRLSTYRKNKEIRRRKQNVSDAKLALKIFILIMLAASLAKIVSYYVEKGL